MDRLEFPKIVIDYNDALGDIIDITRGNNSWSICFTHIDDKLIANVAKTDGSPITEVDVTDIKDDPTVVQQTITRILYSVIYADYPTELRRIVIAGPKGAYMLQKSFEVVIAQPITNSEGAFIDSLWSARINQDGKLLYTIKRHIDHPNAFQIIFPNTDSCMIIHLEDGVMKLSRPAYICNNPDDYIDLTITPTTDPGQ